MSEAFPISSKRACWIDCQTCGHDYEACLRTITKGRWCPPCDNKVLCGDLLRSLHEQKLCLQPPDGLLEPRQHRR